MKKYVHGGDKYGLLGPANFQIKIIDYSANTNPLGMPINVKKAAAEALEFSDSYPDPFCRKLTLAIANRESKNAACKIEKDWIVCGNGAADLIFRTIYGLDLKRVLIPAPTFSEYEDALSEKNVEIEYYYLKEENNFQFQEDILDFFNGNIEYDNEKKIDGIFLCNPNNPVGNLIDQNLLEKIVKKACDKNIFIFLDECFLELTGLCNERSLVGKLKDYDNLIIFKAFTKTYAMAGLRLGYLLTSNQSVADKIFNIGQPWSVSTPAQAAGIAAMTEDAYIEKSVEYIKNERIKLVQALENAGFKVYPGFANYIFFRGDKEFIEEMKKSGILVRDCSNYKGLIDGYMRIAVRNEQENKIFIDKLGGSKWRNR